MRTRYLPAPSRRRRRVAVEAAMLFIVVVLMVQMWLLTATLESYLAGHHEAAVAGVLTSGVLCLACLGMYRFVARLDRAPEPEEQPPSAHGPWEIG